jgi:hypothetical protein
LAGQQDLSLPGGAYFLWPALLRHLLEGAFGRGYGLLHDLHHVGVLPGHGLEETLEGIDHLLAA